MSKILYQLFAKAYPYTIKIASTVNNKARLWVKGREKLLQRMKELNHSGAPVVWMHCSSLGEFEQGRPLLEGIRKNYPTFKILLTFFSPSGYEVRKNYGTADYVFYLPPDSQKNASLFFDIWNPHLVLFVKYEFWFYYLHEAKKRNVPLLLVSAIFRKNQLFFSAFGSFFRSMLKCFSFLFVQNAELVELLQTIGVAGNVFLTGDTRFDRVIEIAKDFEPISEIEDFCAGANVIVAGSNWLEDDKELAHYVKTRKKVKYIVAPHNIEKDRLDECLKLYKNAVLFSSLKHGLPASVINTIIIDNIGMLSRLYKYATICYVGGGFGATGVHNVLEAAVYGKPVVFGPEYEKYNEAIELVETGGGISAENALELEAALDNLLNDTSNYSKSAAASRSYVYSKAGSTQKILEFIYKNRLLTN